jgi:hypothetical protein
MLANAMVFARLADPRVFYLLAGLGMQLPPIGAVWEAIDHRLRMGLDIVMTAMPPNDGRDCGPPGPECFSDFSQGRPEGAETVELVDLPCAKEEQQMEGKVKNASDLVKRLQAGRNRLAAARREVKRRAGWASAAKARYAKKARKADEERLRESVSEPKAGIPFANPIIEDFIRNRPGHSGNRYRPETYNMAHQVLSRSGEAGLQAMRQVGRLAMPSRQAIEQHMPEAFHPQNLTDIHLCGERVKSWRQASGLHAKRPVKAILAVDAICFRPEVSLREGRNGKIVNGLNEVGTAAALADFDRLVKKENAAEFDRFVEENWKNVIHAAFVYMVQPAEEELSPFILYIQPAVDGKASRDDEAAILQCLATLLSKCNVSVPIMFSDADSGYDELHKSGYKHRIARKNEQRRRPAIRPTKHRMMGCDGLHLLKRVRYRLLKKLGMVIGMDPSSVRLDVEELKALLRGILPDVCFCDDPITKMHDSLPIRMFRFDVLKILSDAKSPWFGYFYPWVLFNEAFCNEKATRNQRMIWLRDAYFYLLSYARAFEEDSGKAKGKALYFRGGGANDSIRTMFDRKMLMHAINTINAILCVMADDMWNTHDLSLQRFGTVPVEKRFGRTRLHAGVHQTVSVIIRTMERDQQMQFQEDNFIAAKRQAYGEIVYAPKLDPAMLAEERAVFLDESMAEAVACYILIRVGFHEANVEEHSILASAFDFDEYMVLLIGDCMGEKAPVNECASLYKRMMGVTASARTVNMRAKSEMGRVVKPSKNEWVENNIRGMLEEDDGKGGKRKGKKIRKDQLQFLLQEVEEFIRTHQMSDEIEQLTYEEDTGMKIMRSTRRDLMDWVARHWDYLGGAFNAVLGVQRRQWAT